MAKKRKTPVTPAVSSLASSAVSSKHPSPASSQAPSTLPSRAPSPLLEDDEEADEEAASKRQPFRFFDLPSELRLRIYEEALHLTAYDEALYNEGRAKARAIKDWNKRPDPPLDLDPQLNWYFVRPRMNLFLVSRRMHNEAYRVFYTQTIRLFPKHGRFFNTKKPLLARLPPRYRNVITTVELRLGPGWSKPPKCQNAWEPALGLVDCTNLRLLKIFVECDPSDSVFTGFRGRDADEQTYKWFCVDLLQGILAQVPSLLAVEIDAYPGVKQDAPLVTALRRQIEEAGKLLVWGPLREWDKDAPGLKLNGLEDAMKSMGLSTEAPRVVEVHA